MKYPWLICSKIEDNCYCLNSVQFMPPKVGHVSTQKSTSLVKFRYERWKHALEKFDSHQNADYHKIACVCASDFNNIMTGKLITIDKAVDTGRKNQAEENKSKIEPIIDIVILCGRQGLALCGHLDYGDFDLKSVPEETEGNCRALLRAQINNGDTTLKEHF